VAERIHAFLASPPAAGNENPGGPDSPAPVIIHAALLFYRDIDKLCDHIIIIEAPLLDRINRALARDNLGIWAVFRRIQKQRTLIPQSSQLPADTIKVRNAGTRRELHEAIFAAVSRLAYPTT
jgi:dephospho-CoA kinase